MKFAVATLFALVAVAYAYTVEEHMEFIKRQNNVQNTVDASIAAMTDAQGNVIPFDAANVYLAASQGN